MRIIKYIFCIYCIKRTSHDICFCVMVGLSSLFIRFERYIQIKSFLRGRRAYFSRTDERCLNAVHDILNFIEKLRGEMNENEHLEFLLKGFYDINNIES